MTPLFRAFWIASLASNIGTWVHEIGAGWLMKDLDPSPQMVAAVRTAMSLPIVCLAIPAGALADRIDRRRLLLGTQAILFLTTSTLAGLTAFQAISSWGLLILTFAMGLALVLHIPTWQASIPELVPRSQLSRAVALGSISFNLARTVGPALGGLLIAMAGVWIAFAINAMSFAGVMMVLVFWKRQPTESTRGMTYWRSLLHGTRFVFRNQRMISVLVKVMLFIVPSSVMWSLLPLIVSEQLQWDADGYGILVGLVGAGAVSAAYVLPIATSRLGRDMTVLLSMLFFSLGLISLSGATGMISILPTMLILGGTWMINLTTLNTTAQITLPQRMRARGMGCYLSALSLSMVIGSLLWGRIAEATSLSSSIKIAAVTMMVTAAIGWGFKLEKQ